MNPAVFYIYNSGTVILDETPWWKRALNIRNESDMEFFPLVKELSERILTMKGKNFPLIGTLLGKTAHVLLQTYDLEEVVRLLYLAYITKEDDLVTQVASKVAIQPKSPKKQQVEVEVNVNGSKINPKTQSFYVNGEKQYYKNNKELVEDLFNGADIVVVNE